MKKIKILVIFTTLTLLSTYSPKAYSAQKISLSALTKNKLSSYSEVQLSVTAGEDVEITLQNNSSDSKEFRNWVLVEKGAESEVMNAAMAVGSEGKWTPNSPKIIAKSKLIAAGDSETIQFKAPSSPGEYPYFCTFPGYFMTMKGKLIVKPAKK